MAGRTAGLGRGALRRGRGAAATRLRTRRRTPPGGVLMALGRAHSVAVSGVDGQLVEIEADIGRGLPGVHLVGLPDTALQESRDRVRAAVTNSGEEWPDRRVILALSPATLPKVGSRLRRRARRRRARRREGDSRTRSLRRRCCSVSWRLTAGSGRSAGCCRQCWPRSARAGRGRWCRRRRSPRRVSSMTSRCWARRAYPMCSPGCVAAAPSPRRNRTRPGANGHRRRSQRGGRAGRGPAGRSRSPPPARTTCFSPGRPVSERRCSRNACRVCCRR